MINQITVDHNPSLYSERDRIYSQGGYVENVGGVDRVDGKIAVSRSFGDRNMISKGIVVEPAVAILRNFNTADERYIIMATDGLWDMVENDEAALMVGMIMAGGGTWQDAAERLTKEAYVRGGKDNIGVSIVKI